MRNKSTSIQNRIFIEAHFHLASPLCISSGEDGIADHNVITDREGVPFIPGTSIAGALRDALSEEERKEFMGYVSGEEGRMSALYIGDARLNDVQVSIRDGVKLDREKIVVDGAKYDMEVVETSTRGTVRFEILLREGMDGGALAKILCRFHEGVQRGEIVFGHRKNRGYGKIEIDKVLVRKFGFENAEDYLGFLRSGLLLCEEDAIQVPQSAEEERYYSVSIPLRLEGGISIRQYSAGIEQEDFRHIHSGKVPVVPGTSWSGAIRHQMHKILLELDVPFHIGQELLNEIFGFIEGEKGKASLIRFQESAIQGSKDMLMTRSKVNRFTGGANHQGLFTEKVTLGGNTSLEIRLRRTSGIDWQLGLLILALKDLERGYLAVGGQTSIGRGIFCSNAPWISATEEQQYLEALYRRLEDVR